MRFQHILILLLCLMPALSSAQENFIRLCKAGEYKREIEWLEKVFNTNDCEKIAQSISEKKSFTEVLPHKNILALKVKESWMLDLPHYIGLATGMGVNDFPIQLYHIEPLKEFNNLAHINFENFSHEPICEVVSKLPFLKTVGLSPEKLFSPGVDECLSKARIKVFLAGDFVRSTSIPRLPKSSVIGIENWLGGLKQLNDFVDLQYLDIGGSFTDLSGIEDLVQLSNLSHLSISSKDLKGYEGIRHLTTLQYLNIQSDRDISIKTPVLSALQDISFLGDLTFLVHLNLNNNSIKDLSPVLDLEYLKVLKVQNNLITSVPDLSPMKKLTKLDLSFNDLDSLEFIVKASAIRYLKLVHNRIKDITPLTKLTGLEFLDLSYMSLGDDVELPKLASLKYFVMNGYTGKYVKRFDFHNFVMRFSHLSSEDFDDLRDITETPLYQYKYMGCDRSGYIDRLTGLENAPQLTMLSLVGQGLSELSGISELEELSYLDLSYNSLLGPIQVDSLIPQSFEIRRDCKFIDHRR